MTAFVPRDPAAPRRAVALACGGGAAVLVAVALLLASDARARRADTAEMQDLVARAEGPAPQDHGALLHTDETPQLAQATLQSSVQALADVHGAEIEVMRAEQVTRIDGLVRLKLSVNGTVTEDGLGTFLAALDAARPVILVDTLDLRRTRTAPGSTVRRVAFQFTLTGLAQ